MVRLNDLSDLAKYALFTGLTGERVSPSYFLNNPYPYEELPIEKPLINPVIENLERENNILKGKIEYLNRKIERQRKSIEKLETESKNFDRMLKLSDERLEQMYSQMEENSSGGISEEQKTKLKLGILEGLSELIGEDDFWSIDITKVNNIVENIFN